VNFTEKNRNLERDSERKTFRTAEEIRRKRRIKRIRRTKRERKVKWKRKKGDSKTTNKDIILI
jgi:hypothetical protein